MMIDTDAAILHDCHCTVGPIGPLEHFFYRGFIVHHWSYRAWCLVPVEMPIEEVSQRIGRTHGPAHRLGNKKQVDCINGLTEAPHALIDRFWETVRERLSEPVEEIGS